MEGPHHRKIELQSTADLSYLYANTVALSRQKLDLHFPPSASNDSDPMKERVRELVDEFITKTYTSATTSISINGLDTSTSLSEKGGGSPLLSFLSAKEAVEYEPYDADLAGRVTSLYAQLESLTTTVAQMRRDAPAKAAREYAEALRGVIEEEDEGWDDESDDDDDDDEGGVNTSGANGGDDVDMKNTEGGSQSEQINEQRTRRKTRRRKDNWKLNLDLGSEQEKERWRDGQMRDVYSDALKTLVRLQGELDAEEEDSEADGGRGLATTVGRVERARMAAEVVENM